MNQLHPYSSVILLNKVGGKAHGIYNSDFAQIMSVVVRRICQLKSIDYVCSVPPRPGKENRFAHIVEEICKENALQNINPHFRCTRDYPSQKGLSASERKANTKGVYEFDRMLNGKNTILIDDISSTRNTIEACITALKERNAGEVIVLVMGINQQGPAYWSNNPPSVICPACGDEMKLRTNSRDKSLFYACTKCDKTINYGPARSGLVKLINDELLTMQEDVFSDEEFQ